MVNWINLRDFKIVHIVLYTTSGVMINLAKFCISAWKQISTVIKKSSLPKVHMDPFLAVLLVRSYREMMLLRGICF